MERRLTRFHSGYKTFAPVDTWVDQRPRVLIYLRKRSGLHGVQIRPLPEPCTDLLFLQVLYKGAEVITAINIYNAPTGGSRAGEALQLLLAHYSPSPDDRLVMVGNFNLRHPNWQPELSTMSANSAALVEWTDAAELALISPAEEPTHKDGNVLDLAWASANIYGATTSIETALHTTSDHETLLTRIPLTAAEPPPSGPGRFRVKTMDEELFLRVLEENMQPARDAARDAGQTASPTRKIERPPRPRHKAEAHGSTYRKRYGVHRPYKISAMGNRYRLEDTPNRDWI